MKKSWYIDRRTFLRGAGVSLALPYLDVMANTKEDKIFKSLPKRSVYISFPNGVSLPPENLAEHKDWYWFPQGNGKNYIFRKSQEALNPFRSDI